MGKYEGYDPQEDSLDGYNMWIHKCIANELAEANRLKRFEIEINFHNHSCSGSDVCDCLKELTDQA